MNYVLLHVYITLPHELLEAYIFQLHKSVVSSLSRANEGNTMSGS